MGLSSGFLEFAARTPLPVRLTGESILYGLLGAGIFAVSLLAPILFSRSGSIVAARRVMAKREIKPFFEKFYLDCILLGLAAYQYFVTYRNTLAMMDETGLAAHDYIIDPQIFLTSAFFIIGGAMLVTRLYPYLIRFLFWMGRAIWPPAVYASLSAARSRPRCRYIMLFIIATVSIGLYGASGARTINRNLEDRAMYGAGADVTFVEYWHYIDAEPRFNYLGFYVYRDDHDPLLTWSESSFTRIRELEGVGLATQVYRHDRGAIRVEGGRTVRDAGVTAIHPYEFAQATWWRGDMHGYHMHHLMNALSVNPNAVLLSRNLMERLNAGHGDTVYITWEHNTAELECVVYDAVDFFPKYHSESPDGDPQYLIVMNYGLVYREFRVEPYETWISIAGGYTAADVQNSINEAGIKMRWINYAANTLTGVRNNLMVLSMNGFLTLSFVMTIAITAVGFLMFWIFDLRGRRLQIGIMRSMGLSRFGVVSMLLWEQALLSFLPLFIGFGLGRLGSHLFVPMFEMRSQPYELPFLTLILAADSQRVGAMMAAIITAAILLLGVLSARIKISQTLKLGEE
jgi:putative ABC transport system permease protein